jgi:YVTN family beta-propeller protein
MGRRLALLIATYDYEDAGLRRLTAPAHDAESLAAVLRDPDIADFAVTMLINEPHHRVGEAISELYRDRRRDDLTLLYFTGHGLKDDEGRLHLAMTNTRRDNLVFSALSAEQIDRAMTGCASRQKILILDCCYSGAFPAGRIAKADPAVHALERFQGSGRTVLTSSDSTQYSFEGNTVQGDAAQSVFTRYLVAGLQDGSADLDGDGDVTLDELYGYVYDRVVAEMPQQRPKKQDNIEGRIVIATNVNWSLPAHLRDAIDSPLAAGRLAALDGLQHLHRIGNDIVRWRVRDELRRLVDDDSKQVSSAAAQLLQATLPPDEPATQPQDEAAVSPPHEVITPPPHEASASPPNEPSIHPQDEVTARPLRDDPAAPPPDEPASPAPISDAAQATDQGADTAPPPPEERTTPAPARPPEAPVATEPAETPVKGAQPPPQRTEADPPKSSASGRPVLRVGPKPAALRAAAAQRRRRRIIVAALAAILVAAGTLVVVLVAQGGDPGGDSAASSGPSNPSQLGLAVSPDGRHVYVPTRDKLSVVDTKTNTATDSLIKVGYWPPNNVTVRKDDRRLYVTSPFSNTVTVFDIISGEPAPLPLRSIGVGAGNTRPTDVAVSPDGRSVYVTYVNPDGLSVIDTASNKVTGDWVPLSGRPVGVAVSPDGRHLYVARFDTRTVSEIDTATRTVTDTVDLGSIGSGTDDGKPVDIAVSPDGRHVYVPRINSRTVTVGDTETGKIVQNLELAENPGGVAVSPKNHRLYVAAYNGSTLIVIDTKTNKPIGTPITVGT